MWLLVFGSSGGRMAVVPAILVVLILLVVAVGVLGALWWLMSRAGE